LSSAGIEAMESRLKVLTVRKVGSKPGRQHDELASDLGDALNHQDIEVYFQPQYELRSGRACGIEALARWPRLDGGATPPSLFIPVAERCGMIGAIGVSVLYQACSTVGEWTGIAPPLPTLSVNVSAQQLTEDFSAVIGGILELTEFPAARLELEVTETGLISNLGTAARSLKQCQKLGVQIALDDFGTGYSGLAYLACLPVDRLKLDQSFVQAMVSDRKVAAIVRCVLAMAREMKLEVLAEGIESERQLEMLIGMGCCEGQGNLLAPSVPAEAARELLSRPWGIRHAGGLHAA
jgi:EAL domain-containing protein (putative c-di-GMP-specific phosphodiesterase class I)